MNQLQWLVIVCLIFEWVVALLHWRWEKDPSYVPLALGCTTLAALVLGRLN